MAETGEEETIHSTEPSWCHAARGGPDHLYYSRPQMVGSYRPKYCSGVHTPRTDTVSVSSDRGGDARNGWPRSATSGYPTEGIHSSHQDHPSATIKNKSLSGQVAFRDKAGQAPMYRPAADQHSHALKSLKTPFLSAPSLLLSRKKSPSPLSRGPLRLSPPTPPPRVSPSEEGEVTPPPLDRFCPLRAGTKNGAATFSYRESLIAGTAQKPLGTSPNLLSGVGKGRSKKAVLQGSLPQTTLATETGSTSVELERSTGRNLSQNSPVNGLDRVTADDLGQASHLRQECEPHSTWADEHVGVKNNTSTAYIVSAAKRALSPTTSKLSKECQKRGFNPKWLVRQTPNGFYTGSVQLIETKISSNKRYRSIQAAKLALSKKALPVVRRWPERGYLLYPRNEVTADGTTGVEKESCYQPGTSAHSQTRDPVPSSPHKSITVPSTHEASHTMLGAETDHTCREAENAGSSVDAETRTFLDQVRKAFGVHLPRNFHDDPRIATSFFDGLALGARMAETAIRVSQSRERSRSPGGSQERLEKCDYRTRSPIRGSEHDPSQHDNSALDRSYHASSGYYAHSLVQPSRKNIANTAVR
ncbi:hypothetical protein VTK73DRAFT_2209 [Phialemonium thermophilum]|uniref:Uncharacterized protein n=1 Tax=Phialemonium thermophilum TaxID=223376 RepID=A0ABR3Y2P1_9PEZI